MSVSCQEALPKDQEWLKGPSGCPEVVERPFWKSEIGRETLLNVRECLGDPPGCLGDPTRCLVVVDLPSWMSGSCRVSPDVREACPIVREWSRVPPGWSGAPIR